MNTIAADFDPIPSTRHRVAINVASPEQAEKEADAIAVPTFVGVVVVVEDVAAPVLQGELVRELRVRGDVSVDGGREGRVDVGGPLGVHATRPERIAREVEEVPGEAEADVRALRLGPDQVGRPPRPAAGNLLIASTASTSVGWKCSPSGSLLVNA